MERANRSGWDRDRGRRQADARPRSPWGFLARVAAVGVILLAQDASEPARMGSAGAAPLCGYPPAIPAGSCISRWICVDYDWEPIYKAAGSACDDRNACTHTDRCDANGYCLGTSISCASDTCATRACNGTSSCSITSYAGQTTQCNDGKPCTTGDHCNGSGQCVAGATAARGASCPTPTACGQVCDGVSPYCQPAE